MSCTNNDDNSEWYGSEGIVFTTAIQSRVSGNTWNANDEVGIYMMNAGSGIEAATAQNKKYIAQTNGTLTAAPGNGIYLPESGNVDFIAYYPYTTSVSGNKLAVNVSDQSNPAAIDLIYSNGTKGVAATTATPISLGFTHQLTKVTLNVTKDETIETLNGLGVNIKGISTEGEFNLADGTLTATAGTNNKDVAMYIDAQGTTATATAIILPTAASTDQTSLNLTFNLNGQSFTHTISDASIFEKGKNVSFYANLSINNGKPVVTIGAATIEDWGEKLGGDINVDFDGGTQPGGETVVFEESFATSQGNFEIDNKQLPEGGTFVWKHDAGTPEGGNPYYYMKASAFINKAAKASESWLISPEVDLSTATNATLTFMHIINHAGDMQTQETLWVTETSTENWQQVTIPNYPDGNSWNEVSSGNIDLSAYAGKKIKFAFKYVSTTAAAATWEVYDVKVVANGEGGGSVTPEPGQETTIFIEDFGNPEKVGNYYPNVDKYTGWSNPDLTFTDPYMTASYSEASIRATSTMNGHLWLPANKLSGLNISGFNTSNYSNLKLSFDITGNKDGDTNLITLTCGNQVMNIPLTEFKQNSYITVELTDVPDNITSIDFKSEAATNTIGIRIDNIKLMGTSK
ncbi:fimbrillin family protein [Phocaeicola plebeius]|uniref:fimbrillin family protein n=1 Tax=Phocaeicola plebeius TaxID=310297 RepID=UPI0026EC2DCB|nr:fimbrillin family protein [Phocaeicola plebeius]